MAIRRVRRVPAGAAPAGRRSIGQQVRSQTQKLLETGQRFERFDQVRQRHFWSSCMYVPDGNGYISGTRQLFVTPPGQNGQGFPSGINLTELDTNWKSSNRVPDNQNFEITELGVTLAVLSPEIDPTPAANQVRTGFDANGFYQNSILSITYLTNSVPLGLSSDFAQASGPELGSYFPLPSTSTITDSRWLTNGFAAPALRRRLKIPILLQHGETFSFQLDIPRQVALVQASAIIVRMDFFATESFAEKS